jgi:tetratricopeptide (TPR) repeat protein
MNPLRRGKESLENPLLDYYRNLLDEYESEEEKLFNEGVEFSKNQQYEKAISKFDKALLINPKHLNSYIERGFANHNSGNIESAIKDFDAAIEMNPNNNKEQLFNYRGRLYAEIGRNDEALKNYYLAIESNPNYEECYFAIKEVYLSLGNIKGVVEILTKLIAVNSSNVNYYFDLGIAYGMLNNFNQVINCMDKVLEANPNDSEALYNRGVSKLNIGQQNSGISDIKKSSALGFKLAQNTLNKMGQR